MRRSPPSDVATGAAELGRRLRETYAALQTANEPHLHWGCGGVLKELERREAQAGRQTEEEDKARNG